MKKPSECLHMMLERIRETPKTKDFGRTEMLKAVFNCEDCGTLFYEIVPVQEPKKLIAP